MFYLSEREFRNKLRKQRLKNESTIRKQELLKEKNRYKNPKKKIQTTKIITALLMIFLLLNCIAVEIYSAFAMYMLGDLSALYVLIGAAVTTVIGEVLAYSVYTLKAFKETKAEKDLEFEYHKLNMQSGVTHLEEDVEDAVG